MNNNTLIKIGCIVIAGFLLIVGTITYKVSKSNSTNETKKVKSDIENAYWQLSQLQQEINSAKASLEELNQNMKAQNLSQYVLEHPDVHTDWLTHGTYNENGQVVQRYIVNGNKPILWGLRADGIVLWKSQE